MSDAKLDLILNKLESMENEMRAMKIQLEENTQITKAIHHRQEETDAKPEGLTLDFAK